MNLEGGEGSGRKKRAKTEVEPLSLGEELAETAIEEKEGAKTVDEQKKQLAELIERLAKVPPRQEMAEEKSPASPESIVALSVWGRYRTEDMGRMIASGSGADRGADELRTALFDIVRTSGLGPRDGESIESYVGRVSRESLGASTSAIRPAIFELADHTLLSRGGDFYARSLLAAEYLRQHPHAGHVYVEGATPDSPDLDYTVTALQGGEVKLTRVTSGLVGAKVVF